MTSRFKEDGMRYTRSMTSRRASVRPGVRRSVSVTIWFASCVLVWWRPLAAQTRQATAASYVELGDKWAKQGEFSRAIKTYDLAVGFSPDFAAAYFKRGCARQALRELPGAIT